MRIYSHSSIGYEGELIEIEIDLLKKELPESILWGLLETKLKNQEKG